MKNDSRLDIRILSLKTMEERRSDRSTPKTAPWLAAALALLAGSLSAASAQSTVPIPARPEPAQTAVFKARALSSGWIYFTPHTNFGIYLPVKINGHNAMALLYGGPSNIDRNFVASAGLEIEGASSVNGVKVQIGNLILQNASAKPDDLQKQGYDAKILGQPVLFRLGEEVFNRVAVDIDYPHHRVAFRDLKTLVRPSGAIDVPLITLDGEL